MRKTLPNDIKEILASGDVEAVAEAVKNCEIGAYLRSEYGKPKLLHLLLSLIHICSSRLLFHLSFSWELLC